MRVSKLSVTLTFFYLKMILTQLIDEVTENSTANLYLSDLIRSCGIDNSPLVDIVYEGVAKMETYPWLGVLIYPYHNSLLTTTVILIHKQIVISSAMDIHKLPKKRFRANVKVILGHNCSNGPLISVVDYNYHHEYKTGQYSTLVLIQLNITGVHQELRPICAPPDDFSELQFHAMILPEDCKSSTINIYEMVAVPEEYCRQYYRKSGLDIESLWPKHTACGKARWGGECVWRNGAALVVKQEGRWHLLGFGVNGPGCEAPSRFLDYGMYRGWVSNSVARIGRPAITRMDSNHVILRRKSDSIQRFGPCDVEEINYEIYTDTTKVMWKGKRKDHRLSSTRYNVTLHTNMEYACVVFRATYALSLFDKPKLSLKRYCVGLGPLCFTGGMMQMDFYVQINFYRDFTFKMSAYGRLLKVMDPKMFLRYYNEKQESPTLPWTSKMPIPRDNVKRMNTIDREQNNTIHEEKKDNI